MMKHKSLLIFLTVFIVVAGGYLIAVLDNETLSAYGSILAACGSFTAVIWFTASLNQQAQQLNEQREQFRIALQKDSEGGKRNALLLAKEILFNAEERALASNPEISSVREIYPKYMLFHELGTIFQSEDPQVIKEATESWLKKEAPALILMKGIKSAAQVYFIAIDKKDVDYSHPPETFVYIYGCHLWSLPLFSVYEGAASMLAEIMMRLQPGRKAVQLAALGAAASISTPRFFKVDEIRKDIEDFEKDGREIPPIAQIFREKSS